MLKKTLALASLTLSLSANAAIIDNGTYTTDTDTGFDWLDLTETAYNSFDDVTNRIGLFGDLHAGGWAFATGAQFDTLMENFGAASMTCSNGYQFCGLSTANNNIVTSVLGLFGDISGGTKDVYGWIADIDPDTGYPILARLYDNPANGNSATADAIYTFATALPSTSSFASTGAFLVRTSEVPLPATAWLFLSALGGLGIIKRKRH